MMRDPKRIRPFLDKIAEEWAKNPDLRFGQMVLNTVGDKNVLYNIEEEDFLEKLCKAPKEDYAADGDLRGAHDYFTMTVECSRASIYPNIVRDFYELLKAQGFHFVSGFWDYTEESYETIIQNDQRKLEENYELPRDGKDDYMQLLFDYDGNQETRSYIYNRSKDGVFSFEIIIPEEDILTFDSGKIRYHADKVAALTNLAKKIWELPFVDIIQTSLEYSDVPKTNEELKTSIHELSVEPFAIIHDDFNDQILRLRYEVTHIENNGLFVGVKN